MGNKVSCRGYNLVTDNCKDGTWVSTIHARSG